MALNLPSDPVVGQIHDPGNGLQSYQWNGTAWVGIGFPLTSDVFTFTASGGETTVSVPGGYVANLGMVARGGAMQHPGDDVDVSSGTGILFATPLVAGESILFYKFRAFSIIDALTKSLDLADVPNKDTALTNLGGNVNGRDIFKNATALGAALAKIADAAAARTEIAAPARPQGPAGIGQWVSISSAGDGLGCFVPAGGTWAWAIFGYATANFTITFGINSGVSAGGAAVGAGSAGTRWTGFAWRLA